LKITYHINILYMRFVIIKLRKDNDISTNIKGMEALCP
jgi:hypothetical protein